MPKEKRADRKRKSIEVAREVHHILRLESSRLNVTMGDLAGEIIMDKLSNNHYVPTVVTKRVCKECEEEFELSSEYFHKGTGCIGGFRPTCKECSNKNYELKKDKKLKFNEVMADIREEQK